MYATCTPQHKSGIVRTNGIRVSTERHRSQRARQRATTSRGRHGARSWGAVRSADGEGHRKAPHQRVEHDGVVDGPRVNESAEIVEEQVEQPARPVDARTRQHVRLAAPLPRDRCDAELEAVATQRSAHQ